MSAIPDRDGESSEPSYVDYELFLDPSFSAASFANTLVLSTNDPNDTPLDLATPLSKVLFDIQEVDSHIHTLTSKSALPLLSHTQSQTAASSRIVNELSSQIENVNGSYQRLEKEVIDRYAVAEEVRMVAERLWQTTRLGRAAGRAIQLARQLEVQMSEVQASSSTHARTTSKAIAAHEDHRAMIRAANNILTLRALLDANGPGEEGEGLAKINVIRTLHANVLTASERELRNRAQQIIREFSMSTLSVSATYAQSEETKTKMTCALLTLWLLSPLPPKGNIKHGSNHVEGELMLVSLQEYLRTSLTSSLASLVRSLGSLPTLDRTLLEISARCQNIVALELLLESTRPLTHPIATAPTTTTTTTPNSTSHKTTTPPSHHPPPSSSSNLLQPLLHRLETGSLPSYFWRSLAGHLSTRVQELLDKGGVPARALRSRKTEVREAIRECVVRGSQPPAGVSVSVSVSGTRSVGVETGKGGSGSGSRKETGVGAGSGWEREVAVMVGSVVGNIR